MATVVMTGWVGADFGGVSAAGAGEAGGMKVVGWDGDGLGPGELEMRSVGRRGTATQG